MAWEDRNGREYYYRKKRIGNRVVSEYIGAGFLAELTAEMDEINKAQREQEQLEWKKMKEEVKAVDSELDLVGDLIRTIVRANLLLVGYHPHKGQWRKRRNG